MGMGGVSTVGLFARVPVASSDATGGGPAKQPCDAELIFGFGLTARSGHSPFAARY